MSEDSQYVMDEVNAERTKIVDLRKAMCYCVECETDCPVYKQIAAARRRISDLLGTGD